MNQPELNQYIRNLHITNDNQHPQIAVNNAVISEYEGVLARCRGAILQGAIAKEGKQ